MKTLRYVGHLPRSNPEMSWVVECPWSPGNKGVSFFYFATIEEVLARYPEFTDRVPEVPA